MPRAGRRPGQPGTRELILATARARFASDGFDKTSVRAIASAASVDPALVHHYFGTKEQLFIAALQVPVQPLEIVRQVTAGGVDEVPARLLRTFLAAWDDPVSGPAAVALLRGAFQHEWAARLLREFLITQVLRRASRSLGLPTQDAPLRLSLVASQIIGLATMRYVVGLEPIASAPREVLVAAMAPTLHRYLVGPVS
ncbi:MAG TPA: TetR family transcriptional regulator [Acidimicrobiales bacterium]|nr:TetR family transcriptional regulator [Acidimicrobiales bacterium]